MTPQVVADALGHESFHQTTARSHVPQQAIANAKQERALTVLEGGKGRGQTAA